MYRQTRENFRSLVREMPLDLLNQIPTGFNNNIAWNFAHAVVTQQLLCYQLSGLPLHIESTLVDQFRKGTRPEAPVTPEIWASVWDWSGKTLDLLEQDLAAGRFEQFTTYPTSYGVALNNIDDAIAFFPLHEALHLGYAMAIRRAIGS